MASLDATMKEYKSDPNRIYLTGISMGGNGTWYIAYRNPTKFAAIAPLCGWVTPFGKWARSYEPVIPGDSVAPFQNLAEKLGHIPIWISHGEEDVAVPVGQSRQAAAALKDINAYVQYDELIGIGHNCWDATYGSTKFVNWLFAQRRKP
jgi:predicted peptidase